MSNPIDQIEIKFKDGSPLWVYIQELVPLSTPDGTVVSYTANRIPIEPNDARVQGHLGAATSAAIAEAQRQTQIASEAIAGRDAALARVDNLEAQIALLENQLANAQSKIVEMEAPTAKPVKE